MRPAAQRNAVPYTAPGCEPLPVVQAQDPQGNSILVSAWELSAQETVEVLQSGTVWLLISGSAHPPVSLVTKSPFVDAEGQ